MHSLNEVSSLNFDSESMLPRTPVPDEHLEIPIRTSPIMGTDFFIRPATAQTPSDWIRLANADLSIAISRRMTRTVVHGGEGDDLIDEGAESAVFTVRGEMDIDQYKSVMAMFRAGQPYIHDPFEERDVKVVFSKLAYNGEDGSFEFEFIEDIR